MCYSILLLQFPEHRALLLSSITQSYSYNTYMTMVNELIVLSENILK